jgi:hypothetical protein
MNLFFKVGDMVVIPIDSSAPESCRGKKGTVQHVTKFGYCSVYIEDLRATYLFNPTTITLEEVKTDASV